MPQQTDLQHQAYLARPLSHQAVQCRVCAHFCAIEPGETGRCGVRRNVDGRLYSLVYGRPVAVHIDPIEKKPLFHFLPGGNALSIGTYGCNFRCPFCQNWQMSQVRELNAHAGRRGEDFPPQKLVEMCLQQQIPIIAYTYNEPTVFFEYTYDTARLAHEQGIKNVYVSNGFMSPEALEMIAPYLDGINVDLKAFQDDFYRQQCQARLEPVKRNIAAIARETDIWIEITTLLIPGLNDSEEELTAMATWLTEVDPEMPWHVTAFHPDYQMHDRPHTPQEDLIRAYEIGKAAGLQYVYVGNVMDTDRESTYCPACGEKVIQRYWFNVQTLWSTPGLCPHCQHPIAGVWS